MRADGQNKRYILLLLASLLLKGHKHLGGMADPPANGVPAPQDEEMAAPNAETAIVVSTAAPTSASNALVAVSDVRLAGVDLNEIKKIATMTKAVGVIMPPPDIRAIVDKTASFVAKHGGLILLRSDWFSQARRCCQHINKGLKLLGLSWHAQVLSLRRGFLQTRKTTSNSTSWSPLTPTMHTISCG
jgi:hypothetical protein